MGCLTAKYYFVKKDIVHKTLICLFQMGEKKFVVLCHIELLTFIKNINTLMYKSVYGVGYSYSNKPCYIL